MALPFQSTPDLPTLNAVQDKMDFLTHPRLIDQYHNTIPPLLLFGISNFHLAEASALLSLLSRLFALGNFLRFELPSFFYIFLRLLFSSPHFTPNPSSRQFFLVDLLNPSRYLSRNIYLLSWKFHSRCVFSHRSEHMTWQESSSVRAWLSQTQSLKVSLPQRRP